MSSSNGTSLSTTHVQHHCHMLAIQSLPLNHPSHAPTKTLPTHPLHPKTHHAISTPPPTSRIPDAPPSSPVPCRPSAMFQTPFPCRQRRPPPFSSLQASRYPTPPFPGKANKADEWSPPPSLRGQARQQPYFTLVSVDGGTGVRVKYVGT